MENLLLGTLVSATENDNKFSLEMSDAYFQYLDNIFPKNFIFSSLS